MSFLEKKQEWEEKWKMDAMPSFLNLLWRSKSTTSGTYSTRKTVIRYTCHATLEKLQVTIAIGEVKIKESSSGNLKIKIFQGPPPREN